MYMSKILTHSTSIPRRTKQEEKWSNEVPNDMSLLEQWLYLWTDENAPLHDIWIYMKNNGLSTECKKKHLKNMKNTPRPTTLDSTN